MSDDSQLEYFYRAVSAEELIAIRQAGGLVLNGTEIFITQDLKWVENYVRRSKAGRYDYILEIITMVVYRINETLQTGAVTNRTYRAGETVYLFLKFTIIKEP